MGELQLDVSSIRQRLLEAFRLRSEHAASVSDEMRDGLRERLIEEYASPQAAAEAVWALARENGWHREGELAQRFLLRQVVAPPARNATELHLILTSHRA